MTGFLILVAVVIFTCVLLNNATFRIGVPVLLAFILLGMLFSNNGFYPVEVDDQEYVEQLCSAALIFIMFYGGFGTSWKSARPVVVEAGLLATVGVILTAAFTGLFCHFALGWAWVESFLMGSVIASTDAASVFSILRSRKLGLKNGSAPLLEMESGSNDPCSYMMTILMLALLKGEVSGGQVVWLLLAQLGFGAIFGLVIAQISVFAMRRINFATSGFDSMFLIAIALFSYALPTLVDGNGYLSAYIVGIVLGNSDFRNRKEMVHFFDGFTGLMQVLIFFMLGLLAHPATLERSVGPAVAIFLVLLLVARPLTLGLILGPFRKYGFRQMMLLSFCGLRGAASIVFAIVATVGNSLLQNDIFNIVFCIVLISIALQGSLIPFAARKLKMIDENEDVMKTFSDFSDEVNLQFTEVKVKEGGLWNGKMVKELGVPRDFLLCVVRRPDGEKIVPMGDTVLGAGDSIIVCSKSFKGTDTLNIAQEVVDKASMIAGRKVADFHRDGDQLMLIQRDGESIIPHGNTVVAVGDVLYINRIPKKQNTI